MNCRFFLVYGEPGSPSAFRFMIDLRMDWGEAEKKNIHMDSVKITSWNTWNMPDVLLSEVTKKQ